MCSPRHKQSQQYGAVYKYKLLPAAIHPDSKENQIQQKMIVTKLLLGAILLAHLAFGLPSDPTARVTRQAETASNQQSTARDGRDGRDGLPGPPGPPGHCSMSYEDGMLMMKDIEARLLRTMGTVDRKPTLTPCADGTTEETAAESCAEAFRCNQSAESGVYWLKSHKAYCDMQTYHCGIKGGWMRIASINMSDDNSTCPSPLVQYSSKRLCRRPNDSPTTALTFPTHGVRYNRICGQVVGYQYFSMDGFKRRGSINSNYVDGVSITYGSPKQHIWTYAAGLSDNFDYGGRFNCPCAKYPGPSPPAFVGEHYYCESGGLGHHSRNERLLLQDPLWDGKGCSDENGCCSNAGMPWFCRTLPQEAHEDVNVRLCSDQVRKNEDVLLEVLELYIL